MLPAPKQPPCALGGFPKAARRWEHQPDQSEARAGGSSRARAGPGPAGLPPALGPPDSVGGPAGAPPPALPHANSPPRGSPQDIFIIAKIRGKRQNPPQIGPLQGAPLQVSEPYFHFWNCVYPVIHSGLGDTPKQLGVILKAFRNKISPHPIKKKKSVFYMACSAQIQTQPHTSPCKESQL